MAYHSLRDKQGRFLSQFKQYQVNEIIEFDPHEIGEWIIGRIIKIDYTDSRLPWLVEELTQLNQENFTSYQYWCSSTIVRKYVHVITEAPDSDNIRSFLKLHGRSRRKRPPRKFSG